MKAGDKSLEGGAVKASASLAESFASSLASLSNAASVSTRSPALSVGLLNLFFTLDAEGGKDSDLIATLAQGRGKVASYGDDGAP